MSQDSFLYSLGKAFGPLVSTYRTTPWYVKAFWIGVIISLFMYFSGYGVEKSVSVPQSQSEESPYMKKENALINCRASVMTISYRATGRGEPLTEGEKHAFLVACMLGKGYSE